MAGTSLRLFILMALVCGGVLSPRSGLASAAAAISSSRLPAAIAATGASSAGMEATREPELLFFEEFHDLDIDRRAMYLAALRELMVDIAAREAEAGAQYETTSSGTASARFIFLDRWFGSSASAAVQEKACIYAGWMSTMDFNNRYCEPPKSDGCVKGSVQCNPLLFGTGVCTPRGVRATSTCIRNSKPLDELVKQVSSRKTEWDAFKKELDSYCERGRQGEICYIMKGRLRQMDQVANGASVVPSGTRQKISHAKGTTPPPQRAAAPQARPTGTRDAERIAIQYPQRNAARTAPQEKPVSEGRAQANVASTGSCDPLGLFTALEPPSSLRAAGHATSSLLSFRAAQSLMCDRGAIDEAQLAKSRAISARESERIRHLRNQEVRHHKRLLDIYRGNLEACANQARRLRASGVPAQRGRSAVLSPGENPGSMALTVRSSTGQPMNSYVRPETLGQVMMVHRLNLCDVVDQTGAGGASSIYSTPNSGSR